MKYKNGDLSFSDLDPDEAFDNSYGKICPACGDDMVLREGQYGKFWGCSSFPKCKTTEKYKERSIDYKEYYSDDLSDLD